jgi:hypothetical protein
MRLAKMLQAKRAPSRGTDVDVPGTFLGFCEWLGVELTPGQSEFAAVAYDQREPSGGLGERLFGFTGGVPMGARSVVSAVCGARGGKSYVAVALRLVHGMLVRDLSSLAPGQRAVALIIAPNDKLRREVANYARGAVRSKPELEAMVCEDSAEGFGLRRPDGRTVRFETGVATAGGYGARGRALTDFALDECAFFRDASFKVNDEEIFRAGAARVLPGGQTIVASTPWAQAGLLYELHKRNFGKPQDALVAHAPTLLMHDSEMTRAIVERERLRDPDNAAREFDAKFMTSGTTVFFEATAIDAALDEMPFAVLPGDSLAAGADFGFRSDSSALMLVAKRGDVLHVFDGAEERPEEGKPLKPSATVRTFAAKIAGRCGHLICDQHYREAITEHLEEHGLAYVPAPATPADTYVRARMLLREGRVRIHGLDFRDRLIQQMREVQGRPTAGGGMSIMHPRWAKGGHGDLVAALVLALWQLYGDEVAKPSPALGTREHEMALKKARADAFREEAERPYWKRGGQRERFWRR